jgi:putative acetyltransferase
MTLIIRNEEKKDYRIVEEITRKAFWNLNIPGCDEHYLVNIMRTHPDFIPELDFVLELDGTLIGNIMFTKSQLISESAIEKNIVTFGPVSILPEFQRKGFGKKLIEYAMNKAKELNYAAIVIFGNPSNYVNLGFKSCRKFSIYTQNKVFPCAMLVKELVEGSLANENWLYQESPVYNFDQEKAALFDLNFEKLEKSIRGSQEEFYILSHSRIFDNLS